MPAYTLYSDFKDYGDRYEYVLNTNDVAPAAGVSLDRRAHRGDPAAAGRIGSAGA